MTVKKRVSTAVPRIRAKTPIGILKGVVKIIREEALRYYQGDWVRHSSVREDGAMPPCGTVCCVAGWVVVGKRGKDDDGSGFDNDDVWLPAQRLLQISSAQAYWLFDGSALETNAQPGTKRYVEAGVRHIEKFMRDELGYTGPKL